MKQRIRFPSPRPAATIAPVFMAAALASATTGQDRLLGFLMGPLPYLVTAGGLAIIAVLAGYPVFLYWKAPPGSGQRAENRKRLIGIPPATSIALLGTAGRIEEQE